MHLIYDKIRLKFYKRILYHKSINSLYTKNFTKITKYSIIIMWKL